MKKLVIDGQILQTDAWYRGMGKYLIELLKELNKRATRDSFEISIIFNKALNQDKDRFNILFAECPNIKQLHLELPVTHGRPSSPRIYKKKLEKLTAEHSGSDTYFLITALFFFDFFAEFPSNCKKLILIYDLIPFLFWRELGEFFPANFYMRRFETILEADHIFAISESTKKDLMKCLGLPEERITNINGGFSRFNGKTSRPAHLRLPNNYILFPTGNLPHKNNEAAVKGFEAYRQKYDSEAVLVVTSSFNKGSKERLSILSPNIIFTGHISDSELDWLYQHASVVLFASLHEGLGLPVLDAISYGKPIVASRVPVFEEMSLVAFYFFDPHKPQDLVKAIDDAVSRKGLSAKIKRYPAIMNKYTWNNTCLSFIDGLNHTKVNNRKRKSKKPYIALACVYPGIAGQIGRKAEVLYSSLSEDFRVDFYFDFGQFSPHDSERPTFIDYFNVNVLNISRLNRHTYKKYKCIIYLIDYSSIPSRLAQRASILPGIALINRAQTSTIDQQIFMDLAISNQLATYQTAEATCDLGNFIKEIGSLMQYKGKQ